MVIASPADLGRLDRPGADFHAGENFALTEFSEARFVWQRSCNRKRYAVWVMLQAPRYASLVLAYQGAPDREEDDSAWPPNPKKSRTRMP